MCFKPKMPAPTQEELQAEAELKAMRQKQEEELRREKTMAKAKRTEEAIAKASGRYGYRSLISGGKGGAGFIRNLIG